MIISVYGLALAQAVEVTVVRLINTDQIQIVRRAEYTDAYTITIITKEVELTEPAPRQRRTRSWLGKSFGSQPTIPCTRAHIGSGAVSSRRHARLRPNNLHPP